MAVSLLSYKSIVPDFAGSFAGIAISFIAAVLLYYGLICGHARSLQPVTQVFELVRELRPLPRQEGSEKA